MSCSAPTSAHDAIDVARVLLPGTPFRAEMCRGCVKRYQEMGLALALDRRSDPGRADRLSTLRRWIGAAA